MARFAVILTFIMASCAVSHLNVQENPMVIGDLKAYRGENYTEPILDSETRSQEEEQLRRKLTETLTSLGVNTASDPAAPGTLSLVLEFCPDDFNSELQSYTALKVRVTAYWAGEQVKQTEGSLNLLSLVGMRTNQEKEKAVYDFLEGLLKDLTEKVYGKTRFHNVIVAPGLFSSLNMIK